MEDKTFKLLEMMYVEMQDMNKNMISMEKNMTSMEKNMATKQDIIRLENKMDANDKALYDGYKQTYEKLTILENKVDQLDKKVEGHDVEIRVIKAAK